MKNQLYRLSLLTVLLVLVQGCASTPKAISNVAPDADFGSYSSFGFLDVLSTDKERYESMESNFLKVAVAQELDRRGLVYSESPDLLVNFYIHTQEKVRSRSVPTTGAYYGYRNPFYDPWGGYGIGVGYETRIDQFTEGTLNIDVVDAATKKLVWEGAVSGRITQRDLENMEATIDEAVSAVMANFPVLPGS
jgi:hypothetical protein